MDLLLYMSLLYCPLAIQDAKQEQSLERLMERLRSDSVTERSRAEYLLISAGKRASNHVRPLLASADSELRTRAARILRFHKWGLNVQEKHAIDSLLEKSYVAPEGNDEKGRYEFIFVEPETWSAWGSLGQKPAHYLLELYRDCKPGLRRGQLLFLESRSGAPVVRTPALKALDGHDPYSRFFGISALRYIGDATTVPKLAEQLWRQEVLWGGDIQFIRDVASEAAWTIESLVGYPLDPELWVRQLYPYHTARHGVSVRLPVIRAWWEDNRKYSTRAEWQEAARRKALGLVRKGQPLIERLKGCLLLTALGGEDTLICETAVDIYREPPKAKEDSGRLLYKALGFVNRNPYGSAQRHWKGHPRDRIESVLANMLTDERREKYATACLSITWHLYAPSPFPPTHFGKRHPLKRLRPILRTYLSSPHLERRLLAALTLEAMGEKKVEGPMLEVLLRNADTERRDRSPNRSDTVEGRKPQDRTDAYLIPALQALERLRVQQARDVTRRLLDREEGVTFAAMRLLASVGDESILPRVRQMLSTPKARLRQDDHDQWVKEWSHQKRRQDAFFCFYRLKPAEAVRWWRKTYPGNEGVTFIEWRIFEALLEDKHPIAVKVWLDRGTTWFPEYGGTLGRFPANVVVPALIDLASEGHTGALVCLEKIVPNEVVRKNSREALLEWWRSVEPSFDQHPRSFLPSVP